MSLDETTLRNELRGFDGDLYLTHLFAPSVSRPKLLAIYYAYADMARIPHMVSDQMIGAIRLQWWRDLVAGLAEQNGGDSPIGAALLECQVNCDTMLCLIDGRQSELDLEEERSLAACSPFCETLGGAFMNLSLDMLAVEDAEIRQIAPQAGHGFELLRLTPVGHPRMAMAAHAFLDTACKRFNSLSRRQRKSALPAFLPIGLARYQASNWPKQKSLLAYQWHIVKMATLGRL